MAERAVKPVSRWSWLWTAVRVHRWRILLVLVISVLPVILLRIDAVRAELVSLVKTMREAGVFGVFMLLGFDILAAAITVPTWALSGIAGYVFGFGWGLLVAVPCFTIAASCTFFLGRRFARHWFALGAPTAHESKASRLLRAVQGAVATNGLKVTILLRLTFVLPQNFLGYFLGTTPLTLRNFAGGTFLGMLPVAVAQVYVGSIVEDITKLVSDEESLGGPLKVGLIVGGVLVTAGALYALARVARRALDQTLSAAPKAGE